MNRPEKLRRSAMSIAANAPWSFPKLRRSGMFVRRFRGRRIHCTVLMSGIFEDGKPCESQLVVHTDDEFAIGEPELERDVFAGGLGFKKRFVSGSTERLFE
jgi:hypothetical protein